MLAGRDGSAEYPALPRGGAQTSQKTLGLLKEYVEELSSDSCSNRLLKKPLATRCGVENRFEMLTYCRVRSAFEPIFALHRIHQRLFNSLLRRAGQPAVSAPHGCQTQQACAKQ
jgi:hypothetical protein